MLKDEKPSAGMQLTFLIELRSSIAGSENVLSPCSYLLFFPCVNFPALHELFLRFEMVFRLIVLISSSLIVWLQADLDQCYTHPVFVHSHTYYSHMKAANERMYQRKTKHTNTKAKSKMTNDIVRNS